MEKTKKNMVKVIAIAIITLAILIAEMIFVNSNTFAYGTWNSSTNMPELVKNETTGLFPQILKNVTYSGDADTQFPYEAWTTTMSTGTVYCADQGAAVRYGKYDSKYHYINEVGYSGYAYSWKRVIDDLTPKVQSKYQSQSSNSNIRIIDVFNYDSPTIEAVQVTGPQSWKYDNPEYSIDTSKPMLVYLDSGDGTRPRELAAIGQQLTAKILRQLGGWQKPTHGETGDTTTDPSEKNQYTRAWDGTDYIYGPKVCIMETEDRAQDHYQVESSGSETNTMRSFILTTMENAYNNAIHSKYSLEDVQTAYWIKYDEDGKTDDSKYTRNGRKLYEQAEAYKNFVEQCVNGRFEAKIYGVAGDSYASGAKTGKQNSAGGGSGSSSGSGEAQVIVDQATKSYIVGPLTIEYPYLEDISYLKAIYLKTSGGNAGEKLLVYDENKDDFEIQILDGEVHGSNGLNKKYPASKSKFYVKFSAETTGYPTRLNVYADIEYLSKTYINYQFLSTKANIYQYIGYSGFDDDSASQFKVRSAIGVATINYTYERKISCEQNGCSQVWYPTYEPRQDPQTGLWYDEEVGGEWDYPRDHIHWDGIAHSGSAVIRQDVVFQPFVKMTDRPIGKIKAQKLIAALDGSRTYSVFTATIGGKANNGGNTPGGSTPGGGDEPIDLTFELGGRVWVDGSVGKESAYDGLYNGGTDKPMKNVQVTLYQVATLDGNEKGKAIATTKTDENGEYIFQQQNAMYQYYVEFTYNGQYYQPSIYNVNRRDSNWNNTSKGLDILSERDAFNARFEEIGSSPNNLAPGGLNGEVHTREELENSGAIDEFGNPQGGDSYVTASMMKSYTCNGTSTKDLYPGFQVFVTEDFLNGSASQLRLVAASKIETVYNNPDVMHYINQGYVLREQVDLALAKDVYQATVEINGKKQVYNYGKRGITDENCDVEVRRSGYYDNYYTRPIYREDYDYQVNNYENGTVSLEELGLKGYDPSDPENTTELKVYITYKYTIRNRSEGIATNVTEIADYYDEDYIYIPDRSYLEGGGSLSFSESSIYGQGKSFAGYNTVYITNGGDFPRSDPDGSKDVVFYVTFLVKKYENGKIILDEGSEGKQNIAEINGYKSYYGSKAKAPNSGNSQTQPEYSTGDIAGIADKNSTPGNISSTDPSSFENDTDKAPNIKIVLNRENLRTVEGTVWEDERTVTEQLARVGNGKKDNETGINGVRVQLVELRTGVSGRQYEFIWKEVYSGNKDSIEPVIHNTENLIDNYTIDTTNANGKYKIAAFAPGNYIVRFIYGSDESTVLGTKYIDYKTGNEADNPVTSLYNTQVDEFKNKQKTGNAQGYSANSASIGLNTNSYNGQDYKSTSYQVGVDTGASAYGANTTQSYIYSYDTDNLNCSDAKDIMYKNSNIINISQNLEYLKDCNNARTNVEAYSNGDMTNGLAQELASYESIPTGYGATEMQNLLNNFMKNTYMVAESGVIDANFEYNRDQTESDINSSNLGTENYVASGYFTIPNLDLGLVQRPKAQLKVTKQITNVKMTLANNSVLFDASARATNVLWMDHKAHGRDTENVYSTDKNYSNSLMLNPVVRQNSTNKGKVQLTMDEELMHGSTLQITYAITVANVGEVDYKENQFYYTGKVADTSTIVKTNPRKLIDYVGTQVHDYNASDDRTTKSTRNNLQFNATQNDDWEVITLENIRSQGLVNSNLESSLKQYTTIIVTKEGSKITKDLVPVIADQTGATEIKDVFKNDPLHALDTVNQSKSVSGVQLILTQMITQDNSSDDRTYNNMTELVTTKNTVGRRMAYSIVGNQDPTVEPREIDADDSQEVVILPPFGNTHLFYVLSGVIALILITGITITLVVLKKKK